MRTREIDKKSKNSKMLNLEKCWEKLVPKIRSMARVRYKFHFVPRKASSLSLIESKIVILGSLIISGCKLVPKIDSVN